MIIPSSLALLAGSAVAQPASYAVRQPQPGPPLPGLPSTKGFQNVTVHPSTGGHASCVSGIVPVAASTDKNVKLDFQVPANQSDITEFFLESFSAGSDLAERIAVGNASVAGEYDIYATLCTPMNNSKPKSVQLLTHGVGFDHTYWDFALDYSYVDVAAEHGYASFFYDRLGVGSSDKPDPIQVIQAPLEVEIARTLATFLRNGTFSGQSFEKVIGVGHSFGSIITQAITQLYPEILDAAVLTGFSSDLSNQHTFLQALNLAIARENQPARFSALNNAFLVSSTIISNQIGFFKANGFDPAILRKAEATKGTVTIGELNSLSGVGGPADRFTKPVIVVDGDADYPFCTGNCSFPTNLAQAVQGKYYPSLADGDFDAYLAPLAGHGLNFHYSARKAFEFAQEFLAERGL